MIGRTAYKEIEKAIKCRPVTLITGARQVGKTSLAVLFKEKYNFNYVSLGSSIWYPLSSSNSFNLVKVKSW